MNFLRKRKKHLIPQDVAYFYILPWLVGFVVLQLYPFGASLYYSFTNYSIVSAHSFIGARNYVKALTDDNLFWQSLKVTFQYVIFSVPVKLGFALFIAIMLNMKIKLINIFSIIYYLPSILGGSVGISILWKFLFARYGYVNLLLDTVGIGRIDFIGNPDLALYTISLLSVWQFGSSMVLFLAALKQIPQELIDAARVDGAGKIRFFTAITLPLITPVLFFNLIMQTINAFQQFSAPYLITGGGPLRSTYLYGLMLYENAFKYLKMGYSSALSWILFVIILVFTALVFKSSPYWTYYEDSGNREKE